MFNPHIEVAGHAVSVLLLALIGVGIGYIAGMFGIGGGFLLTPILNIIFGIPIQIAVGSALCQKVGTSIASFLKYRHLKRGEPRIDMVMIGGSVIGVDAGTRFLKYLTTLGNVSIGHHPPVAVVVLDIFYAIALTAVTAITIHEAILAHRRTVPRGDKTVPGPLTHIRIPPYIDLPNVQLTRISVPVLCYCGFLLGALSGLMGIGGGIIFMPVLLYGYGLSVRNAAGTGIFLLLITVATGTITQAIYGFVDLKLAMAILIGSSIGSQLGVLTTNYLSNRILRLAFGGLVGLTVLMILADLVRGLMG